MIFTSFIRTATLCVLWCLLSAAYADVISQRDGSKIAGNIVKEDAANVTIEGTFGRIVIPRAKIATITKEKMSQIQLYATLLEKQGPNEPLRKAIDALRTSTLTAEEQHDSVAID